MAESSKWAALEPSDFGGGMQRMSNEQALRAISDWRANYGSVDEETAQLLEAKMVKAFTADGYNVPAITDDERLKILRQRAARRN